MRELCHEVKSQETCAKTIGDAPLAHPILDVRLIKDISMTSTIITVSKNEIDRSHFISRRCGLMPVNE